MFAFGRPEKPGRIPIAENPIPAVILL